MNIVLANSSYSKHTTSEGFELELGLAERGWLLTGNGYGDNCRDVPTLLERYKPERIFVQDVRDFHRESGGSFGRKDLHFERYEALRDCKAKVFTVLKDAGTSIPFQRDFASTIKPYALLTYYHDKAVLPLSPWAEAYKRIRIYHSVDGQLVKTIPMNGRRRRAVVSGAVSGVYPLRRMVFDEASRIGVEKLRHPGYGNQKTHTPDYLRTLAGYKVHVATCSAFSFALRKIVESVACCCTPITNLPSWDVLPEIDGALVRIPHNATILDVKDAVDRAEREWKLDERKAWADKAIAYYDWRESGKRMHVEMTGV